MKYVLFTLLVTMTAATPALAGDTCQKLFNPPNAEKPVAIAKAIGQLKFSLVYFGNLSKASADIKELKAKGVSVRKVEIKSEQAQRFISDSKRLTDLIVATDIPSFEWADVRIDALALAREYQKTAQRLFEAFNDPSFTEVDRSLEQTIERYRHQIQPVTADRATFFDKNQVAQQTLLIAQEISSLEAFSADMNRDVALVKLAGSRALLRAVEADDKINQIRATDLNGRLRTFYRRLQATAEASQNLGILDADARGKLKSLYYSVFHVERAVAWALPTDYFRSEQIEIGKMLNR